MNTLVNSPIPGKGPDLFVEPLIARVADLAAAPSAASSTWRKIKDTVVIAYAYGLLAFGILFPFLLAAWTAIFGPGAG